MPSSQAPSRRTAGVGSRPAQPKRSAPCCRQATRLRLENGSPRLGMRVGLVADPQLDRVEPARDRELVDRRLEREHAGALAGGAHPGRRRHVERREPVRGASVRRRVHHPRDHRGLLGELLDRRGLLDDVVADRLQAAVAGGAEPQPLDRRRAVAGQREHLLPRRRELDRAADGLRRHRRDHDMRARRALRAEAAADVRARSPAPAPARARTRRRARCLPSMRPASSRRAVRPPSASQSAERRVRLHRVVVAARRLVGRVDPTSAAANAASKSPTSVSVSKLGLTLSGL